MKGFFQHVAHLTRHEPALVVLSAGEVLLLVFTVKAVVATQYGQASSLLITGALAGYVMYRWAVNHYKGHK